MKDNKPNSSGVFTGIIFGCFIFWFVDRTLNKPKNPRIKNGTDWIKTADSIYKISFKIDSVYEIEVDPGDQEDPRR